MAARHPEASLTSRAVRCCDTANLDWDPLEEADCANASKASQFEAVDLTTSRAILTDYASGIRGKNLSSNVQVEAAKFLTDLEKVYPGAAANVVKQVNNVLAGRASWKAPCSAVSTPRTRS